MQSKPAPSLPRPHPEHPTAAGAGRVRPDALSISTVRPDGPVIEGQIYVTELLGGDMLVDVQLADARIRVKTSTEFTGVADDPCYMTVNRDKWHLFDIEDGHAYF